VESKQLKQSMVCLDKDDERVTSQDGILGLLRALLSDRMTADTRKTILCDNYGIEPDVELEKELSGMCNLSYGVLERGIKQGIKQGREEGREEGVLNALKNLIKSTGYTFDKAADMLMLTEAEKEKYRKEI
jgi:predicted transposase YdaD